jgi:hypothetical protein
MIEGGYTTQDIGASDHPFWNPPQPTSIMEGNTAHMCISLHKNACAPWEELLDHRAAWTMSDCTQVSSVFFPSINVWDAELLQRVFWRYWNWTKYPQSHSHIQLQSWPWSTFRFVIQVAIPCHSQFSTTAIEVPGWWGEIPGWRALFVLGGVLSALVGLVIGIFMANASASSAPHRTRSIDFWVFHWDLQNLQMQTSESHNSQFSDGKVESRFCVGKSSWYFLYLFVFPTRLSLSLSLFLLVWAEISISRVENCGKKNYSITIYYYLKLHQIRILHKHLQFGGMA